MKPFPSDGFYALCFTVISLFMLVLASIALKQGNLMGAWFASVGIWFFSFLGGVAAKTWVQGTPNPAKETETDALPKSEDR